MSGGKSSNLDNLYLQWAFTANALTRPSAYYLALFTDASGRSTQPATEATTTNCPGYARVQYTGGWTVSGASAQNAAAVTDFVATGAWATIYYWAIMDASTNGNMLYWGTVNGTTGKTLANTDHLQFGASTLNCTEA